MSKNVFIGFEHRGFWAFDVVSNVFVKYLIDAANQRLDRTGEAWLSEAVQDWRINAAVQDLGNFLFRVQEWPPERRKIFSELAAAACEELSKRDEITADEISSWPILDELRIFPRGLKSLSTASVIRLGRAAIDLVNGVMPEPPPGTWWYFGSEDQPRTTPMAKP